MNPFTETLGLGATLSMRLIERQARGGDQLRGRIELSLPEPLQAESLTVTLLAQQRLAGLGVQRGRVTVSTRKPTIFRSSVDLAGPQRFTSGGWDFSLPVPQRLARPEEALSEGLRDLVTVIRAVQSPVQFPLEWFVEARLHRSWKIDLKQQLGVTIELGD